ncbi:MAG: T9SS type A sorting domain-containing protein [Breznakibacter sp.]
MRTQLGLFIAAICLLTSALTQAQTQPDITMTTSLPAGSKFTFSMVMTTGNDIFIDFGDGNKVYKAVSNTTTFTETLKGSTVKIYNTLATNAITGIECKDMHLTAFDASNEPNIYWIDLSNNDLTSIDLSKNTNFNMLTLNYNKLKTLTVNGAVNMHSLFCAHNELTSVTLTNLGSLEWLDLDYNQLTTINPAGCPKLYSLSVMYNQLSSVSLASNTNLWGVYLSDNKLKSINISALTALEYFSANDNQLTSLDISKNTLLKALHVANNQLAALNVDKNTSLSTLRLGGNNFTFKTLPLPKAQFTSYDYSSQNPIIIGKSYMPGQSVDLSSYKDGQGKASTYVWYDKDWNEIGADYVTVSNGIATFKKAYTDSIRCEIGNADFPRLWFLTGYAFVGSTATGVGENKAPATTITSSNNHLSVSTDVTGNLAVFNVNGKLIKEIELTGHPVDVEVPGKGIYMVTIAAGKQVYSYKALAK